MQRSKSEAELVDGVLTRSFLDITILACTGCVSVRQVVWSLNTIPENNVIVGELVLDGEFERVH